MKNRKFMILLSSFLSLLMGLATFFQSCSKDVGSSEKPASPTSFIEVYQIDPLVKILPEQEAFTDDPQIIRVARGEHATVQLLVKSFDRIQNPKVEVQIADANSQSVQLPSEVYWVGYVGTTNSFVTPSRDLIRSSQNHYPDVLFPWGVRDKDYAKHQPFWISVPIARTAIPGTYKGKFTLSGAVDSKSVQFVKEFTIEVYPPVVQETSLLMSNWHYFWNTTLAYMNNRAAVTPYSTVYWELIEEFAKNAGEFKSNVHYIDVIERISYALNGSTYSFDFTNFDREVGLFMKYGDLKYIAGSPLSVKVSNSQQYQVRVPKIENGVTTFVRNLIGNTDATNFYNQVLPALRNHLLAKGWYDIYLQHIGDEPNVQHVLSYKSVSAKVREHMPGVKILDAMDQTAVIEELSDYVDIVTPILDKYHENYTFLNGLKDQGKEIWFYTCVFPQANYANRFIQLPLVQTRLLHWINFKYGATGYLHWAANFWETSSDPYTETTNLNTGYPWPGGDSFIVYPGYRRIYSSIRQHALRDGVIDYELLKMLSLNNPAKAKQLANALIFSFDSYDKSIEKFRAVRKELLEELSN